VNVTDVVLDVDTGVDDALALLLAVRSPALRVLAVTCVAGNVGVDQVVRNTLQVLEAAGTTDIPVARGCDRPLVVPLEGGRSVHGADGMADLGLPAPLRPPAEAHAVDVLGDLLTTRTGTVTLLALGPLTNVATLLQRLPQPHRHLDRIVVVGGDAAAASEGDVITTGARQRRNFNLWQDPDAAEIVAGSGVPVLMYTMDVFFDVALDKADAEGLSTMPEPGARLAGRLLLHQVARHGGRQGTIGDAGAVAAVVDPAGVTTTASSQVEVVTGVDAERHRRLFVRTLVAR
jgi:pyrimidine-specific ribonucleoside hydrolase